MGHLRTYTARVVSVGLLFSAIYASAEPRVSELIREKWLKLNLAHFSLGPPITEEKDAVGGRYTDFLHGSIYLKTGAREAFSVFGDIAKKWYSLGRERGLGFPTNDESPAANGGRFSAFDHNAFIFWKPEIGAKAVYGFIADRWSALGRESGRFGYPITDEFDVGNAGCRASQFQGGVIYWNKMTSKAKEVLGLPLGRVVNPVVTVDVQPHTIFVNGSNFSPNWVVDAWIDDYPGGRVSFGGNAATDADGHFQITTDIGRCVPGVDQLTLRFEDRATGVYSTAKTSAFRC